MVLNKRKLIYMQDEEALIDFGIISVKRWLNRRLNDTQSTLNIGVLIKADDDISALKDGINSIDFIVVDFSDFEDGRTYSKVKILRGIFNYSKEMIAIKTHLDQLQLINRCGIDSFTLSDEYTKCDAQTIKNAIEGNTICYQESYNNDGLVEKFKY